MTSPIVGASTSPGLPISRYETEEALEVTPEQLALKAPIASPTFTGAAAFDDIITKGPLVDVRAYLPADAVTDSSVDYQTGVAAAVAAAYAAGRELYWPNVYLTTVSIPNFHDVKHKGPGGVKRGSFTFYISPRTAQTNTLYVATTGSDTNDGLHSSQPILTIQRAANILRDFAPKLPGRWIIKLAAGTYTENVNLDSLTEGEYPITITGPAAGHPNVPTAIIAAADTANSIMRFSVGGWWILTDIKVSGATTSHGILNLSSYVSLNNVHVEGCKIAVEGQSLATTTTEGGIWVGPGKTVPDSYGYSSLYNSAHAIASTSAEMGTQISFFETGLFLNEGAQGHVDYTQVSDCTFGVKHQRGAGACNTNQLSLKRNTIGYAAKNSGWFNNGIQFGTGADANDNNIKTYGDAPEFIERTQNSFSKTLRQRSTIIADTHTGTTAKTSIWTLHSIASWWLGGSPNPDTHANMSVVDMYLQPTLTGICTLFLTLGGTDVVSIVIPAGITNARVSMRLMYPGVATQRAYVVITHGTGNILAYATSAVTVKNTAVTLELKAQLANSADTLIIRQGEYSTTIGG